QVRNETSNVYSLPLFDSVFVDSIPEYVKQSEDSAYVYNFQDNMMFVEYVKPSDYSVWPSLDFYSLVWHGDTTNVFTKNVLGDPVESSVAQGYSVNFSSQEQRIVTFEIQTEHSLNCFGTLVDLQGKISNSVEAKVFVNATTEVIDVDDESKWKKITMTWTPSINSSGDYGVMKDEWSTQWWGRSNIGLRNDVHKLDSVSIVGFNLYVDPVGYGTPGLLKEFVIRNVVIGNSHLNSLWHVEDYTENVSEIPFFSEYTGFSLDRIQADSQYDIDCEQNILTIGFTNTAYPQNNKFVQLLTVDKQGDADNYFVTDYDGLPVEHDTLYGFSVDFSSYKNRLLHFQAQSSDSLVVEVQLIDINGKISDTYSPHIIIPPTQGGVNVSDNSKWNSFSVNFDDVLVDVSSMQWWNRDNQGYRDPEHALDSTRIVGIRLCIDPGDVGELQSTKMLYIRNAGLGKEKAFALQDVALDAYMLQTNIDLSEYYIDNKNPQYNAFVSQGNEVDVSVQGTLLTISAIEKCLAYTNTIMVQIQDDSTMYQHDFVVVFTPHDVHKPLLNSVSYNESGNRVVIERGESTEPFIDEYRVYARANDTENFQQIGSMTAMQHDYTIEDIFSHSVQYALTCYDYCNTESEFSDGLSTVFMMQETTKDSVQLTWNYLRNSLDYQYVVLAGSDSQSMDTIATISREDSVYILPAEISEQFYRILVQDISTGIVVTKSNIVDCGTDILDFTSDFKVYPTHSNSYVYIETDKTILSVELYSLLGISYQLSAHNSTQYSLHSIPSGMYILFVETDDGLVYANRIVKQ
ncbi:MAG: T9SS type A sorting domain-containing protein, partial [Bacteroidota bacterium]